MTKEATANQEATMREVARCPKCRQQARVEHWNGYSNYWCVPCGWTKRVDHAAPSAPVPADKPTDRPSEQAAPELLPCPFCLKPVTAREIKGAGYSLVGCNDPSCVASAISALPVDWNVRADLRTVSDAGEARPTLRAWAVECRDSALSVARQFTGRGKRDYEVRATCWQSLIDEIDRRAATRQASTGRVWDEAIRLITHLRAQWDRTDAALVEEEDDEEAAEHYGAKVRAANQIIAALRAARNLDTSEADNFSDER